MNRQKQQNNRSPNGKGTEIYGITLIVVSAFLLICLIFTFLLGFVGDAVKKFILGVFGLSAYAYLAAMLVVGIALLTNRRPQLPKLKLGCALGMFGAGVLILHLISSANFIQGGVSTFASYMSDCFNSGLTFGGVILGVIVYPVQMLIGKVISYILYALIFLVFIFAWTDFALFKKKRNRKKDLMEPPVSVSRSPAIFQKEQGRPAAGVAEVGESSLFVTEIRRDPPPPVAASGLPDAYKAEDVRKNSNYKQVPPVRQQADAARRTLFSFMDEYSERDKAESPVNNAPYSTAALNNQNRASSAVRTSSSAAAPSYNMPSQPPQPPAYNAPSQPPAYGAQVQQPPMPTRPRQVNHGAGGYTVNPSMMPGRAVAQPAFNDNSTPARPAQVVHNASVSAAPPQNGANPRPRSTIINGAARSKQLAEQKEQEEKIAQAEQKIVAASTYVAPAAVREQEPPRAQKFIVGDEESKRLREEKERLEQEALRRTQAAQNIAAAPAVRNAAQSGGSVGAIDQFKKHLESNLAKTQKQAASATPVYPFSEPAKKQTPPQKPIGQVAQSSKPPLSEQLPLEQERAFEPTDAETRPLSQPPLTSGIDFDRAFGKSKPNHFDKDNDPFKNIAKIGRVDDIEYTDLTSVNDDNKDSETISELESILNKEASLRDGSVGAQIFDDDLAEDETDYKPATTANIKSSNTRYDARRQLGMDDYMTERFEDADDARHFVCSDKDYARPSIDLLENSSTYTGEIDESCQVKAGILEDTLKQFNVPVNVVGISKGPAATRYELQMFAGTPVSRVREHSNDIAYALAAKSGIRIETPIPGKQAVGVEVPNEKIDIVSLREIVDSKEFHSSESPLCFALGKDVSGKIVVCDLFKMPHLLIAGSTNSGKSSCLNSLITSLVYKSSPSDLRMILIDPKRVEFVNYEGLPHLLLEKPVTTPEAALNALKWAMAESERRFMLFSKQRVRDLKEFNRSDFVKSGKREKLPYIVIVIDELADLMSTSKKDFEDLIRYITQKSRAAGIHLVVATQRPSVDVVTGTIKANLTSRIAFAVTNFQDSKTILDTGGAENLLGRGDMLYAPQGDEMRRVQGAYVTSEEVSAVVINVIENNEAFFGSEIYDAIYPPQPSAPTDIDGEDDENSVDVINIKALRYFIDKGYATISNLQRKFSIGFNKAANIVDYLEANKYIGPSEGGKAQRQVLVSLDEFIRLFGDVSWQ